MTNLYYNKPSPAIDFTRARGSAINAVSEAADAGFALIPPPDTLDKVAKPAVIAGGTANAILIANADPITGYSLGQRIAFKASFTNTTSVTINVDGIGVKSLVRPDGSSLVAADITSGRIYEAIYDGIAFQLLSGILDISDEGVAQFRAEVEGYANAASDDADVANEASDEAVSAQLAAEIARDQAQAAAAGFTAAGMLASIKTVDGTGSGLDTDLVRGTTPGTTGIALLGAANAISAKTLLALENVSNTADADKPVSTATQAALNAKASLAGANYTGQIGAANGSAGAPSLSFVADNDTGFYLQTAGIVGLSIGGVLRVTYTPSLIEPVDGIDLYANLTMKSTRKPATSASSGTVGMISFDSSYIYVCTGSNSWKRAALSTF